MQTYKFWQAVVVVIYFLLCMLALLILPPIISGCGGGATDSGEPPTTEALETKIISVTIPNAATTGGSPEVLFQIANEEGVLEAGHTGMRFIIAKLKDTTDGYGEWQSYITRTETHKAGEPGETPIGFKTTQATTDNKGELVDHGDGTYTYTFSKDIGQIEDVSYEANNVHRVVIQIGGHGDPASNPVYDFIPATGVVQDLYVKRMVNDSSCNECHGGLAFHGGGRIAVDYCVTCHNPYSTDAQTGNTVNFGTMIHKIHRGEDLPSVIAGIDYKIYGYRTREHNYSDVVFPQSISNCVKCHNSNYADIADGDLYYERVNSESCGSCHDHMVFQEDNGDELEDWQSFHPGGANIDDDNCNYCHGPYPAYVDISVGGVHN